ncbi:MAG TPA: S24 family peptidase [Vineibacter sp.]|nr:S24 family peptidase [Vineibacter sp.]
MSQQAVAKIENGETERPRGLPELARALKTTERWLLKGRGPKDAPGNTSPFVALAQVMIVGHVQAGVFREAMEWPEEDWKPAPIARILAFERLRQFGLEVRGTSMNLVYPPGAVAVCVSTMELGRDPKDKERVVVLRREQHGGDVEATVKELRIDDEGAAWLWPRSSDPHYQEPWRVTSLATSDDNDDLRIVALVIGAYIPEAAAIYFEQAASTG